MSNDKKPKLPKLPEELEDEERELEGSEDEDDTDNDDQDDAPKRGWQSWVRIGVFALLLVVAVITLTAMCGKRKVVQPTNGVVDTTATVQQKQPQQSQPSQVQPAKPPVQQQVQQPTTTAVPQITVPAGGTVLVFNYIIRNGTVQNGESTIALIDANGQVSSIQINGEMYNVDNPQVTRRNGQIVAVSWGPTVYVINEETANSLGLEARSPYNDGKSSGRRIQDTYIVQANDTADEIRKRFGMKVGELKGLNRRYDLNNIWVGQKLIITRPE
jgi:LysM repeat protein